MKKSARTSKKLKVEKPEYFGANPFGSLEIEGLPNKIVENRNNAPSKKMSFEVKQEAPQKEKIGRSERLEVRREKSGRGGKTVTTIKGFPKSLAIAQRTQLLKKMKVSLGTGGTWNDQVMELQGDRREEVMNWLSKIGFKPVLTGG